MSEYTKEELEALKVAELKQIANDENLDVSGLRKAEIIEKLLENQNIETIENEQEVNEVDDQDEVSKIFETANQLAENIENINNDYEEIDIKIQTINAVLNKPTMLFEDKDLKVPMFNISGLVELNIESGAVSCNVPGRGVVNGFIAK